MIQSSFPTQTNPPLDFSPNPKLSAPEVPNLPVAAVPLVVAAEHLEDVGASPPAVVALQEEVVVGDSLLVVDLVDSRVVVAVARLEGGVALHRGEGAVGVIRYGV